LNRGNEGSGVRGRGVGSQHAGDIQLADWLSGDHWHRPPAGDRRRVRAPGRRRPELPTCI